MEASLSSVRDVSGAGVMGSHGMGQVLPQTTLVCLGILQNRVRSIGDLAWFAGVWILDPGVCSLA